MLALLLFTFLLAACQASWPRPRHESAEQRTFKLSSSNFVIDVQDSFVKDLFMIAKRAEKRILETRHSRLTPAFGEEDRREELSSAILIDRIKVVASSKSEKLRVELARPLSERDEAYELIFPTSDTHRSATLRANSSLGVLRGLQTLEQMVYWLPSDAELGEVSRGQVVLGKPGGNLYLYRAPLRITDAPQFPYRGLLLDTARHWYSLEAIERTIEAMATAKLNTFHWHITESQSWPLVLPMTPELARHGAYSADRVYTPEDIQHIERFAAERGVSLMLEVDMPGHTASIGRARPDLIACMNKEDWSAYAAGPPSGQLKLVPKAERYAVKVLAEASQLSSFPLFCTGGDEINMLCYEEDDDTQAHLNKTGTTLEEALASFMRVIHEAVQTRGKTPVVWEEVVLNHNLGLDPSTTPVLVWINSANVRRVIDKGHPVIHAASDYFYLDCGTGGWLGNSISNSWCDPFKTWQKIYSFDPFANLTTPEERSLVLGGQALLWSEQADETNLDSLLWPRAAAAAEVFWSGKSDNMDDALARLHDWRYRAVERGVGASPLQPEWCARRPGQCNA